ncbi:hypothetical protein DYB32_005994 [Aphanomyces invadans]|uniref:C3HC-type domain-containing protein n=1 Tax=Aphanomyces invadans TaxID=157072 RepID=A0A418AWL3_9STRA|nr:hypothetical protein DYB32_005994 [Aphanomyces invadans]
MKAKSSHESIPHAVQAPKDVFTQCHPNNRADFQARVDTYSSLYWFAKPAELNLLTCARFGWINTGPDELACKCCHQTVLCRIDSRLGPEVRRFTMMIDSSNGSCAQAVKATLHDTSASADKAVSTLEHAAQSQGDDDKKKLPAAALAAVKALLDFT